MSLDMNIDMKIKWWNLDTLKFHTAFLSGLKKGLLQLEYRAKQEAPTNTGMLRNKFEMAIYGLKGTLSNSSKYAQFVHDGRAPGKMPPIWPIEQWATRKGINIPAFVIARSIARKWTKANTFMQRTQEKEEDKVRAIFESEIMKLTT